MSKLLSFIRTFYICMFVLVTVFSVLSCKKDLDTEIEETEEMEEEKSNDTLAIYVPNEFRDLPFESNSSTWSYNRSRQSEHFIVFWGADYGNNEPNAAAVPEAYKVDIDDLLEKAEQFYDLNINTLKFADIGMGKSNLDKYKMMIFLHYTTEWMAYGSGYDDVIGALWISPSTAKPVGHTIAHEIGHSFQYQVYCDLKGGTGFRYGFGGNGGNTFWEQTAQWQANQSYPVQAFAAYDFTVYTENYHRHLLHENYRYASYFIHEYWADKHGIDIIGRIWREAQQPEDPIQTYMRITGVSDGQLNDELYDAASKFVTWDIDAIRTNGQNYIGAHTNNFTVLADGSFQVAYDRCPGTTGYNVIPLDVPLAGTTVSCLFTGMVNAVGFNQVSDASRAGWRYGYVALLANGTRVYGDMAQGTESNISFTVPQNCDKLWFVVTGAPTTYAPHAWDEIETNDDQWPYKVKFTNTSIVGYVAFEGDEEPEDITLTYDVSFPYDAVNYSGTTVSIDRVQLAQAFVLQPSQITGLIGNSIKFYAIESNGSLNERITANGYGHWFDANGDLADWAESSSRLFSEFNESTLVFNVGQYPGRLTTGDEFTIRQALVYEYETGKNVQATFVFNVKII